jgi:hypothetical protein
VHPPDLPVEQPPTCVGFCNVWRGQRSLCGFRLRFHPLAGLAVIFRLSSASLSVNRSGDQLPMPYWPSVERNITSAQSVDASAKIRLICGFHQAWCRAEAFFERTMNFGEKPHECWVFVNVFRLTFPQKHREMNRGRSDSSGAHLRVVASSERKVKVCGFPYLPPRRTRRGVPENRKEKLFLRLSRKARLGVRVYPWGLSNFEQSLPSSILF